MIAVKIVIVVPLWTMAAAVEQNACVARIANAHLNAIAQANKSWRKINFPQRNSTTMIQREPDLKQALLQLRPGMIRRVALRTGSRDLAEEVVQVALLKALEGLGGLKDPRRLKSWFGTIVQHSLQDQFRHWSRQAPLEQAESLPDLQAEEKAEPTLSCGCVLKLLPTLRPAYAQLLEAVDLRGDSLQKLAQNWGLSPNNLSVRLHRARQALRKELGQRCGTHSVASCLECGC
jgi:RNA polymerase sigma-70 factor (ECF subfamily)